MITPIDEAPRKLHRTVRDLKPAREIAEALFGYSPACSIRSHSESSSVQASDEDDGQVPRWAASGSRCPWGISLNIGHVWNSWLLVP